LFEGVLVMMTLTETKSFDLLRTTLKD